jgi:hypothetical protein
MHIRPPSKSDESAIRTVHETAFRHEGGREIADLAVEPLHDPTAMPVAPLIALVVPGSKEGANARGIGTVRCACAPNRPQHWRE